MLDGGGGAVLGLGKVHVLLGVVFEDSGVFAEEATEATEEGFGPAVALDEAGRGVKGWVGWGVRGLVNE